MKWLSRSEGLYSCCLRATGDSIEVTLLESPQSIKSKEVPSWEIWWLYRVSQKNALSEPCCSSQSSSLHSYLASKYSDSSSQDMNGGWRIGRSSTALKMRFLGHPVVQHQVRFVFANVWDDSPILNLRYISWKHCGDWRISSPRDKLADCGLNGRSEGGQHLGEEKDKNSIW